MSVRTLLAACLAFSFAPAVALAQGGDFGANFGGAPNLGIKIDIKDSAHGGEQVETRRREVVKSSKPGETFEIVYEETEDGSTGFKVLEPEGYRIRVTDGGMMMPVKEDSIPTSFSAKRGKFYRFEIFSRDGLVFDKKFEAKPGMMGTLAVTVSGAPVVAAVVEARPARAASTCMAEADLSAISAEIESANFSEEKVGIIEEAMKHRSICGDQVIKVLGLYNFSADKLGALTRMAPKIADPANNFKIYGAFTFSGDKEQAKKILSR